MTEIEQADAYADSMHREPSREGMPDFDRQRALGWPDFHPEDYCHKCGAANPSWYAERDAWEVATKEWAKETGREGICCPGCFAEMHEEATGFVSVLRIEPQIVSITDRGLDSLLTKALKDEDVEMVELCETALKPIVQPNIKRAAIEQVIQLLNARSAK